MALPQAAAERYLLGDEEALIEAESDE